MGAVERGIIQYRSRAEQGRDFSGLRFGNITPTDVDAFIDFRDRAFVFIEAKYGDQVVPDGQRLALERLCDACQESGRWALVLIASHHTPVKDQIDFASCDVREFRFGRKWRKPKRPIKVRVAVERFISWQATRRAA